MSLNSRSSLLEILYKESRMERGGGVRVAGANVINVREGWSSNSALASHFNPFNRRTVTCATILRGTDGPDGSS